MFNVIDNEKERKYYHDLHNHIQLELKDIRGLGNDWDSYGALPPREEAINAVEGIASLIPYGVIFPRIYPTPSGDIQMEWEKDIYQLEMEVKGYFHYNISLFNMVDSNYYVNTVVEGQLQTHLLYNHLSIFRKEV